MMRYIDALEIAINDGIEAARMDYGRPDQTLKRDGAIQGFEDCRGKSYEALATLRAEAATKVREALQYESPQYWYWRCREAEIEWVCNVMSCIMHAQGVEEIVPRTARGMLKAAEIIGVKGK